ncbi:coiled-coil domain containing 86 [Phyllostomus discolor]|uniref:Coiled-coil domain-containing protein 86 n=1 Tax=Phyllostomus discolor TaxID=89673 RepID=A0A6J2LY34_9CHIR|nr:coiled-coil domain-containing protein 86 [Phyllostomus discolor]KAF6102529.1 coiled-coil domain containing 86 [Phyllostomus discolor]
MDTPVRRSRRLGDLKRESPESPTSVLQARPALVEFESNPEETREPASPPRATQPGLESPESQPETCSGSPSLRPGVGLGSPRRDSGPRSPQGQREAGLESPRRQPQSSLESPRRQPKPGGESPKKFFQSQEEPDAELAHSREELAGGSLRRQLQPGPGSPEPNPGQQAPGPEPSPPLQDLTPQSADPTKGQCQPPPAAAGKPERDGQWPKKRKGSSTQAPAPKKLKEEVEIPVIPKGKPKSGRVWKDRSKKRFSQMVQDKPLRTSWQRKMKERQEKKLAKDFARHLEEEKERRRQEKKQRRAENLRRRLENERKAEIVQVIRNPAKLKRAKKKQLRSVEKRDTLALLQKQPPQRPVAKV